MGTGLRMQTEALPSREEARTRAEGDIPSEQARLQETSAHSGRDPQRGIVPESRGSTETGDARREQTGLLGGTVRRPGEETRTRQRENLSPTGCLHKDDADESISRIKKQRPPQEEAGAAVCMSGNQLRSASNWMGREGSVWSDRMWRSDGSVSLAGISTRRVSPGKRPRSETDERVSPTAKKAS